MILSQLFSDFKKIKKRLYKKYTGNTSLVNVYHVKLKSLLQVIKIEWAVKNLIY